MSAAPTLLLVEDSEDDVFLMQRAFQKAQLHHPLQITRDGTEAMAWLSDESHPLPALVLLDLNLPVQSGLEILRWIRAQPRLAELRVYVYSASIRSQDAERAKAAGATEYLIKPAGTDELIRLAGRLKTLLEA